MNDKLSAEQLNNLSIVLDIVLFEYNVEKKSTELAIYDDSNEIILKNFLGDKLLQGRSERTIRAYEERLRKMIEGIGKPVTKIEPADIRGYLAKYLTENQVAPSTMQNARNYYMSFFSWMENEDLIEKNPMRQIQSFKVPKKQVKAITEIEVEKLRSVCDNVRDRALIEFLFTTDVRAQECSDLNFDDFDFPNRSVTIVNGKGGKERTVYLSDKTILWIERYLKERTDNESAFWVGKKGRLTVSGIEYIVRNLGEKANLKHIHPHQFRHGFATEMARKGMSAPMIQIMLGHESLDTTRIYMEIQDSDIKNAFNKFVA